MKILIAAAAIAMLFLPACKVGKSAKDLPIATLPGGAPVTVALEGMRVNAELIAVRDDGVVLTLRQKLTFFPFASLGGLAVEQMQDSYRLSPGERPVPEKRERLRLISRFPQGLTPEIERLLLAQMGQSAIETVR